MKIKELLEKGLINKDHWLLKATVQDEDVDIIDGAVIWHNGTWKGGSWFGGMWHGGAWEDGIWNDGVWYDGIWYDGVWKDGVWFGGMWCGGDWEDGATAIKSKYAPLLLSNGKIRIGCKTKTIEEWDVWFNSIEEYDTPRDSKEFKLTYKHFNDIKAYYKAMRGEL